MTDKPDLIEEALQALNLFELRREKNEDINDHIRKVYPEFPPLVQHMDDISEAAFVKLLDAILGGDLASYYLYERPICGMEDIRAIYEKDVKYPLTSIAELALYIHRNKD